MLNRELVREAHQAATDLGHEQIGVEHLLLAIVHPSANSSARVALGECDVTHNRLYAEFRELPATYLKSDAPVAPDGGRMLGAEAVHVIGRAEGMAIGMGTLAIQPEHVLMSLIWDPSDGVAITALERLGATRARLLEALVRQKVAVPSTPLRKRKEWSEFRPASEEEVQALASEYAETGVPYRVAYSGDHALVSVAVRDRW